MICTMMLIVDHLPWSVREKLLKKKMSKFGIKGKPNPKQRSFAGWAQFEHIFKMEVQKSKATLKVGDKLPVIKLTNLKTGKEQGYVKFKYFNC